MSDAGPLHYLILIGEGGLPGLLFTRVVLPGAVREELLHAETPATVRNWLASPPEWLTVSGQAPATVAVPFKLDAGERAVIDLAAYLRPDLLLMDDRAGVRAARTLGFAVTGTLGVLYRAAVAGHVDLGDVYRRLAATSFRCTPKLLDGLLARFAAGGAV